VFAPTNPAAFGNENLKRLLGRASDGPPDAASDALLLNMNIALAHGAHLLGARDRANQYFERARLHLADLFDVTDYAVAEAMFAMGFYLYSLGKLDQFSYYVSLAMKVCERLNATDSTIYGKCLIAVNVDPTYTLSQKETLVDQYLYNKSITQDHAGGISNRSGKDVATAHLARVTHIDQYILQLQVLLARLAESRKGEPQRNTLLLRTKAVLHAMRKHLAETSTNDPVGPRHALSHPSLLPPPPTGLGAAYNTSVGLSWHGATTFYYLYSSRESVALAAAIQYLEKCESTYNSAYCAASTVMLHKMMMDFFIAFKRYDLVRRLLVAVTPFMNIHPLCFDINQQYLDLLSRSADEE